MTRYIARENIPFGGVLAYTKGQRVEPDAVKANGWEDFVVGDGTKEARQILAEITGEPLADSDADRTTSRRAAATSESKEG